MGDGGSTENTDGSEPDNVIRFPRDWFGAKEDLVPFGPAADRLEAAVAAARAEQAEDADLAEALTAHDFWGASAGALHQPIGVPQVEEPAVPAEVIEPSARAVRTSIGAADPVAPVLRVLDGPEAGPWRAAEPPRAYPAHRRPVLPSLPVLPGLPGRRWLSGLAVAVMLICAVGVFLLGRTHATPTAGQQPVADSSVSVPPGPSVSEAADLLAIQGLREAGHVAAVAQRSSTHARRRVKHRAATARRSRRVRHTASAASGASASLAESASAPASVSSTESVSEPTSVSGSSEPADGAASTDSAASAGSPTTSAPSPAKSTTGKSATSEPATKSSSSSSASSSLAPGPTTAGSAGSDCNPQCQ